MNPFAFLSPKANQRELHQRCLNRMTDISRIWRRLPVAPQSFIQGSLYQDILPAPTPGSQTHVAMLAINAPDSGQQWEQASSTSIPTTLQAVDGDEASCLLPSGGGFPSSRGIIGKQFGFTLPTGSTVTAISLRVHRYCNTLPKPIYDKTVRLTLDGTSPSGTNMADATPWERAGDGTLYWTYSGGTWGLSLTDEDVNDVEFGVYIQCESHSVSSEIAKIGFAELTIDYVT